jgi:hypothetical protein
MSASREAQDQRSICLQGNGLVELQACSKRHSPLSPFGAFLLAPSLGFSAYSLVSGYRST